MQKEKALAMVLSASVPNKINYLSLVLNVSNDIYIYIYLNKRYLTYSITRLVRLSAHLYQLISNCNYCSCMRIIEF